MLAAGEVGVVNKALDKVRQYLAKQLDLVGSQAALLWVTDFPMYEWNADEERLEVRFHGTRDSVLLNVTIGGGGGGF